MDLKDFLHWVPMYSHDKKDLWIYAIAFLLIAAPVAYVVIAL